MATVYKLSHTGSQIDEKLGKVDSAITFTNQTLTDEQKARARENIGAADMTTTEVIKNIVTTKNLLNGEKLIKGYKIRPNGSLLESTTTDHWIVTLPAGTYKVLNYSDCCNLTTGEQLLDGSLSEATFTLTVESKIGINSYKGYTNKLFSSEYTADEVEAIGTYTLSESVLTPDIDNRFDVIEERINNYDCDIADGTIKNIVTTKNLLQYAEYKAGHRLSLNTFTNKIEENKDDNFNYYKLKLPAGTYGFTSTANVIWNLTTGTQIGILNTDEPFTLDAESEIAINSWKDTVKKLYSTEYTADEVEAIGEYTIGNNVNIPIIDNIDKQIAELVKKDDTLEKELNISSIKNIVTTKNLLSFATEYVEGYSIYANGTTSASTSYDYYKLTLPAGEYKVRFYGKVHNLTTGVQLTDGGAEEQTFTLTEESEIGVNSYKKYTTKLFSSEYTADEVEVLGEYALKENVIKPFYDCEKYGLPVLKFNGDITGMNKDNAVTLNYIYGDRTGTCTLKWQGNSSLSYPKKNYTVKFDNEFEAVEGWGEEKKYCLKANYIDFSHARNLVGAKLWGAMVQTRTGAPEQLLNTPNGGAVDGFPICVVINGKYVGLYTFNIPKDGWMFSMGDGANEAIVCAEQPQNEKDPDYTGTDPKGYRNVCAFKDANLLLGIDYEVEYAPDEDNVEWMQTSLRTLVQTCIDTDGTNLAALEAVLDVNSAIDYYIFSLLTNNYDGITKNHLLATYDGTKWMFGAYDMDCLFGMYWNGSRFTGNGIIAKTSHKAFEVVATHYKDALKARYQELRESTLSEENFATVLTNFIGSIPKALLDEEVKIWTGLMNTSANNQSQMLDWYRRQVIKADAYIKNL